MAKYRKKPVVIEAVQIVGGNGEMNDADFGHLVDGWMDGDTPYIDTLEGRMTGTIGDWIITGVKGERYFCKPDIFAATYEPAE